MSCMSRTSCFLKNKPWYQRLHVLLVCGATYLCAIRERDAGLSTLQVGAIWQEHGLSPTALLGTSPSGDGYVSVWREDWPSCLVPVPMSGVRKQGQNKTYAFGQSCPYNSSVPELSLFFQKGTGLSRSLVP